MSTSDTQQLIDQVNTELDIFESLVIYQVTELMSNLKQGHDVDDLAATKAVIKANKR